ncbi:IST1-like protein [Nymphaea thermarum]|nr:IST1-like protein [Nymphaea thermarum]
MSKLNAFFNKGSRVGKCKTLLNLVLPRIKLLRNRREIQLKQLRREIAKLLQTGQEATACIRAEHIIREQKMMDAQEIIELFSELIIVRLPIMETQRECPLDLKEAISTLCFAAPRCADLPELLQVQTLFAAKYGKEFVAAATEFTPDSAVNRQVIELLSVRAPPVEEKLKLLKEIAEEHELHWDPTATEKELLKSHEDLLHGPTKFTSGSKVRFPKEKHVERFCSGAVGDSHKQADSEAAFETSDLPEVPQGSIRKNVGSGITTSPAPAASSQDSAVDAAMDAHDISAHMKQHPGEDASGAPSCGREHVGLAINGSVPGPPCYAGSNSSVDRVHMLPLNLGAYVSTPSCIAPENKFHGKKVGLHPDKVKLESPPCVAPSSLLETTEEDHLFPSLDSRSTSSAEDKSSAAQEGKESPCCPQATSGSSLSQHPPSISRTKVDSAVSFQDVLVAAEQAAETAERAAAAARSAASLAQVRISEIYMKKNNDPTEIGNEGVFHNKESHDSLSMASRKHVNSGDEPSYPLAPQAKEQHHRSDTSDLPSYGTEVRGPSGFGKQGDGYLSSHQPQQSASTDDDPYFSYPNLFTSQGSNRCHTEVLDAVPHQSMKDLNHILKHGEGDEEEYPPKSYLSA